ncbi:hypothetical protein C8J56DRAFT_1168914 [Mycena floridula]|nr:hypothetical protein C8J56DRAFT_1168914 [Mycena floridula]
MLVRAVQCLARPQRTFTSSALVKKWDELNVTDLRSAAKSRQLPSSGSKAALIQRLRESERSAPPSRSAQRSGTRNVSTEANASSSGSPKSSPSPAASPTDVFNIRIPEIPAEAELEAKIPVFPNSSQDASTTPKLLVLDGDFHPLSHNLLDMNPEFTDTPAAPASRPAATGEGGLIADVFEDLGILRPNELKKKWKTLF